MTVVLNVQDTLQAVVSSRKGAGSDLLTRDCAFTSIVQTTADEVTALVATVCCEWQMRRHVPDFGALSLVDGFNFTYISWL